MAQPDNLESRVSALESEVRELNTRVRRTEQDAAAARVLAGGADREVGEIRAEIRDFRQATTSSFNAMGEDLTDLGHKVDIGFAETRAGFDVSAAGQEHIVNLLNTVIAQQTGE